MANIVDTAIKIEVLSIKPSQVLTYLTNSNSLRNTCPCCSDTLLRHISLRGMYWRCSSCYQEMPAQKSLQERQSEPTRRFAYARAIAGY